MNWFWWIGIALVVVLALYAAYSWFQVWQQHQKKQAAELHQREQIQGQLAVMARAVTTEQVNVTEGALRLSFLLQQIDTPINADVAVIHEMAEASLGFDIRQARAQLSEHEKQKQDEAREVLEQRYQESVLAAAQRLLESLPEGAAKKLVVS